MVKVLHSDTKISLIELVLNMLNKFEVLDSIHPEKQNYLRRDVLNKFNDLYANLMEALQGHVNNIGQTLAGHGADVLEKLQPHFDNLKDQLTQHGLNAAQSILDALANASGSIGKRDVHFI